MPLAGELCPTCDTILHIHLHFPFVLGNLPVCADPFLLFEPMQRRIPGPRINLRQVAGIGANRPVDDKVVLRVRHRLAGNWRRLLA